MKIIFQSRTTLFSVPGGDTIQIMKTAEALKAVGCKVDISTKLEPDVSGYDLVHLFNLTRPQELYLQAVNAKKQRKRVALSTIYVDYNEYDKKGRSWFGRLLTNTLRPEQVEYLKVLARTVKNFEVNKGTWFVLKHGYKDLQSKIMSMTDVFLPNSESEMKRVSESYLQTENKPYIVVPNALDTRIFDSNSVTLSKEAEEFKDCVLCVARIEGGKGQLNLVRAMKDLHWTLILIGNSAPNHLAYFRQVKKEAGSNVHVLGHIEHSLLPQFYKAAKVHALISWMETTGLSSLEAGAMGCNLVITEKGDTRDYFGDYAFYCEPDSVDSIRKAIIKAYEIPINAELREQILKNFTWEKAAEATLKGYTLALQ